MCSTSPECLPSEKMGKVIQKDIMQGNIREFKTNLNVMKKIGECEKRIQNIREYQFGENKVFGRTDMNVA